MLQSSNNSNEPSKDIKEKLLDFIRSKEQAQNIEIAEALDINIRTIRRYTKKLMAEGLLERMGEHGDTAYRIKSNTVSERQENPINRNTKIAFVIGFLAGGLACFLFYQSISLFEKNDKTIDIFTSTKYIPAGVLLKSDMVTKKAIPESFISPSAIRELWEVEGLVTLCPISKGEQILSNKFGTGTDLPPKNWST